MSHAGLPPLNRVIRISSAISELGVVIFVVLFSVVSIALSVAVDFSLTRFHVSQPERVALLGHGLVGFFVLAVLFGPPVETLLLQQLPISIARHFRMSVGAQFAMGSIPFAAVHFSSGVVTGLAGGLVGGLVFALAYLTYVSESKAKAFAVTTAIHSLHNLVPVLMYARGVV